MKKVLYTLLAAFAAISCRQADSRLERADATVYFAFDSIPVKSLNVNDTYISDCNIFVYNSDGTLVESSYSPNGAVPSLDMAYSSSETYKFYCVCNIGDISTSGLFQSESSLLNYQYSIEDYSGIINSQGAVPMSGHTDALQITDGMTVYINLTRCVALITIRIDDSGLDCSTINIESIALKNTPSKVGLFAESAIENAAEKTDTGDSAASAELATFNTGSPVGFYMFENSQGELLPDNNSCTGKYFDPGSSYEELCSYVELCGTYNDMISDTPRHGTFSYRFYLGENTTTDFSVIRNHHYNIVLMLNDGGIDETSWRVDQNLTPYATAVIVTPDHYTFPSPSGTCDLTATVLPSSVSQTVTWSSSNPSVASVDQNGTVSAHSPGEAVIRATATDGSGVYGTSSITVLDNAQQRTPVSICPNLLAEDGWILGTGSETEDFEVTITYDDGSSTVLSGSEALDLIDNSYGDWVISGSSLAAPDYEAQLTLDLIYEDPYSGTRLTFGSVGESISPENIFTLSYAGNVAKKYGDLDDRPIVVSDIVCYSDSMIDLSGRIVFSCSSSYIEADGNVYRVKGDCSYNGDIYYTITGSFDDDFNNPVSKTVSCMSTIFEWCSRYYIVEINTMVREHIDTGYGSQEPADNIVVTVTLHNSSDGDSILSEYYFPASYDEDGDLVQGNFSYTWYQTTLTCHMQDRREFIFNYDSQGRYLLDGFCYVDGWYIYYEPYNQ